MKVSRTIKLKNICNQYFENGCRKNCPLSKECKTKAGDDYDIFTTRMNEAAEKVND